MRLASASASAPTPTNAPGCPGAAGDRGSSRGRADFRLLARSSCSGRDLSLGLQIASTIPHARGDVRRRHGGVEARCSDRRNHRSACTSHDRDTICALASAPGRAGVAVIRISGPGAGDALRQLCGPPPPPRQASLRKIKCPGTGEVLDRGLALWLPGPASFTGEDIAELHIHGGRAVVGRVIDALLSLRGVRLAEPGEFARRAFENGQASISPRSRASPISSTPRPRRRRARRSRRPKAARGRSTSPGARISSRRRRSPRRARLRRRGRCRRRRSGAGRRRGRQAARRHRAPSRTTGSGERLRDGFRVVIAGPPNVGKSSLLNALARRDVAIVSEEAGTTRDVIEVHLDLRGLPVIVTDTAGIREAAGRGRELRASGGRLPGSRTPISCCGWSMPPRPRRVPRQLRDLPRNCASSTRLTS